MHSHAGAWERASFYKLVAWYAFPRWSVGTSKLAALIHNDENKPNE